MWVIVEGSDGGGKSTLAVAIASLVEEAELTHLGPPMSPESALDECITDPPFGEYLPMTGVDIVSDRHHWGNPIYGPTYRPATDSGGYGEFGRAGWRYAELFCESRGAVTVLVDVDPDLATERVKGRGDNYVVLADLPDIIERYRWLCQDSVTCALTVKLLEEADTKEFAEYVLELAKEKEAEYEPLSEFRHYVGPLRPDKLVLSRPDRHLRLEILDALPDDDAWMRTGLASSAAAPASLADLWETLERPEVVALGRVLGGQESWVDSVGGHFVSEVGSVVLT